jgi:hypothetical protein
MTFRGFGRWNPNSARRGEKEEARKKTSEKPVGLPLRNVVHTSISILLIHLCFYATTSSVDYVYFVYVPPMSISLSSFTFRSIKREAKSKGLLRVILKTT